MAAILSSFFPIKIQAQLNINLLSHLPYQLPFGERISNIGGYVDALGNEYALVGHPAGLSIVNVTDPVNPYQVFMVPTAGLPGNSNNWREVKTMGNYAYVVTEAGGGLQIVDLSGLPNNYQVKTWTGDGPIAGMLNRAHALHVDDNHVYIYGTTGLANGGIVIANINDPWNPTYAGMYDQNYVHDGYVRADTVYAAQIYVGTIAVIDVSNKANPQVVATFGTPTAFPHNTWLSDDSKTLFTTDENSGSFLASFDVSDKSNITELDRVQSFAGNGSVVHNTHVLNDYTINSWYVDGINIVDGARPGNLIETGFYDLSPLTGPGFDGVWGVYPYLPSGNLVVSHRDSGLYILSPTYIRGAYLEGVVTDSVTGLPLANVFVEILSTTASDLSDIAGDYKTGTHTTGTYTIKFSKTGYANKIISNVYLENGILNLLNVELIPSVVSVNENIKSDVKYYPNPAQDYLHIESELENVKRISIMDLTGKLSADHLIETNNQLYKLDISQIKSGFYFLKIETEKALIIHKFNKL